MLSARTHKHGFTIIELLVVISMISFLSVTILSRLNTARIKAEDARKLSIMKQYFNATILAYDKYGEYPDPGDTTWRCLGDHEDDQCGWDVAGWNESPVLNDIFDDYLPLPVLPRILSLSGGTAGHFFEGPAYQCLDRIDGRCVHAQMLWYATANNMCGSASSIPVDDITACVARYQ